MQNAFKDELHSHNGELTLIVTFVLTEIAMFTLHTDSQDR